eukprot:scaffold8460_cov166-Amphora_coffeaeformis.AAC.1
MYNNSNEDSPPPMIYPRVILEGNEDQDEESEDNELENQEEKEDSGLETYQPPAPPGDASIGSVHFVGLAGGPGSTTNSVASGVASAVGATLPNYGAWEKASLVQICRAANETSRCGWIDNPNCVVDNIHTARRYIPPNQKESVSSYKKYFKAVCAYPVPHEIPAPSLTDDNPGKHLAAAPPTITVDPAADFDPIAGTAAEELAEEAVLGNTILLNALIASGNSSLIMAVHKALGKRQRGGTPSRHSDGGDVHGQDDDHSPTRRRKE